MPPVRFFSFLNPACLKICRASADRLPDLAVQHDLVRRVELVQALLDRRQRDQLGAGDLADGVLIRLADINQGELVAPVHLRFEFARP